MVHLDTAHFDETTNEPDSILHQLNAWEVALDAVSRLAVVFALSLALILILAHQLGQPI